MSNRWIVALIIIAGAPAAAAAQFTTFIAPPNPAKDSIKAAVVAEQKVAIDSLTQAKITDMKTWVDSAAGIAKVPSAGTPAPINEIRTQTPTTTTTTVSNGAVAPATASTLPLLMAVGIAAILLGFLLIGQPQLQPRRIDRTGR